MKNFNTKRRLKACQSIIHKLWKKYYAVKPIKTELDYKNYINQISYWSDVEDELLIKMK